MKVLVMAKAPVAGLAKTRLAAVVGDIAAAELAAAGLLDTLAACRAASAEECVVALTGDMDLACRGEEIGEALQGCTVLRQRGEGFDERLANAHHDCGDGALIQIGMDTPQVTPAMLTQAWQGLDEHDTALGLADDGGWWVFGRHDASVAASLVGVPMSTPHTGEDTRAALVARGLSVGDVPGLRDVDEVADAEAVAQAAPHSRFARTWAGVGARA